MSKSQDLITYATFWNWFQENEKAFTKAVKERNSIEADFFDKLSPKLAEIKDGFYFLTGMYNDSTVELIITAEGYVKNLVFVEELVNAAPDIPGWKFTALKPSLNIRDVSIEMAGYSFNAENINFYSNVFDEYPDEIDITVVHDDLTEDNRKEIVNGTCIFLDNYLGELDFVNNIDNLTVVGKDEAKEELIPITKLKDFLVWRQKEFREKYEAVRYDTANDEHSVLEAELRTGNNLLAVVNTTLLQWDAKASHPWIGVLTFKYDGSNHNGMPNNDDYQLLNTIEDEIMQELKDVDGYLNIGRQTAEGEREVYFACQDFRKPSKVFFNIQKEYSGKFGIEYDIYKDKYWQSFNRFTNS